jgi:hypothetical protein
LRGAPSSLARGISSCCTIAGTPPLLERNPMRIGVLLYVLAMIALIVGMDIAFFRDKFWERLIVNIAIVAVFAIFYLAVLRHR